MDFELLKELNEMAEAIIAEKVSSDEKKSAINVSKDTAAKVYRRGYLRTKNKPYRKKHSHSHSS